MSDVRLRIPELMERKGWTTGYQLAKNANGRISPTNAYHLVEHEGEISRVSMKMLDALCEIFGVTEKELLSREPVASDPLAKAKRRKTA